MAYESFIGGRYLLGSRINCRMLLRAGVAAMIALFGLAMIAFSDGSSPFGVIVLLVGVIASAVLSMMSILSVFTSVAVLGVALGVAALTVALSVTTGFQLQFREKVLGVNAHVIVRKQQTALQEYREVMKAALKIDDEVLAAHPFIFAEMLVTRGNGQLSGVAIKGVDPELVSKVLDLDKHMLDEAKVQALAVPPKPGDFPPIIMGKELARKLKAKVGEEVTVVVPLSNLDFETFRAKSTAPSTRKFRVAGIFYSGFDEYDRRLMYTSLKDIQELLGRGDHAMGVELKVKNVDRAAEIARALEDKLGGSPYQVQDWYELNRNLFVALEIQKKILVLILTIIILVATFNMVSAIMLMVTEKTREVAILKGMGTSNLGIALIFQFVGLAITGIGTLVGVGIGLVTCYVVSGYGLRLEPKVYLIDRLPIVVRPVEILIVVAITMAIGLLVTLLPSWGAALLRPADGLRHD